MGECLGGSGVYPNGSGVYPGGMRVYPDGIGVLPRKTPGNGKAYSVYPDRSGAYPDRSGVYPGGSGMYPGLSGVFPDRSGVFPRNTPGNGKAIADFRYGESDFRYGESELRYGESELRYGESELRYDGGVDKIQRRVYPFLRDAMPRPKGEYQMGNKDYVPDNDGQFLEWAKNLYAYALAHFAAWNIRSPQSSLEMPLDDFEDALAGLSNPNYGKVDMERKRETRKVCEKAFRVYVQGYLARNPAVTDEDRVAMRITVYKPGKSKRPEPETVPELVVDTGIPRRHKVYYRDRGSERRGRPAGVAGIEIRWAILDHYPVSVETELFKSSYDTASPWVNDFDEADRGKKVYYCGRWEAPTEGVKGPFGEVVEAIVP
jgi:hypothetical protein